MNLFVTLGGILGFLAVGLGAFGAHALKGRLSAQMLTIFETGSHYHLVHALALVLVGALASRPSHWLLSLSGWAFTAGTVIFCGALYLLALTGTRWLGAVAPIGGIAFLVGWLALALFGLRAPAP